MSAASVASRPVAGCYLLHFDPPYKHARHYLGWADDIERRVREHLSAGSKASPLVRAALAAGCKVRLARVWAAYSRDWERSTKNGRNVPRLCPECRAQLAGLVSMARDELTAARRESAPRIT